jgi:hypothetical protein
MTKTLREQIEREELAKDLIDLDELRIEEPKAISLDEYKKQLPPHPSPLPPRH